MSTYRVFLGAPSKADIQNDPSSYSWQTLSSSSSNPGSKSLLLNNKATRLTTNAGTQQQDTQSASVIFPFALATLEAASMRITMIYKDVVFGDGDLEASGEPMADEDGGSEDGDHSKSEELSSLISAQGNGKSLSNEMEEKDVEVSVFRGVEQTTLFTWPPTAADDSRSSESFVAPSFLLDSTTPQDRETHSTNSKPSQSLLAETQDLPESQSFGAYSDASSIGRFPSFHFSLHTLSSLGQLSAQVSKTKVKFTRKVNLLLAVLEVEGPDSIRIKKGEDAGMEVSILKVILGDEEGEVCKLTAWRDVADDWGGNGSVVGLKRGDIVHMENVMAACDPIASITLSASTYLKAALTICYRTMPYTHEDGRMRPDLRLGVSEPCVRKVAAVVRWFEQMAGLLP